MYSDPLCAPYVCKKLIADKQRVRLICSHDLHRMKIILSCRLQRIINTLDLAGLAPEDVGAELVVARPVEPDRVVEVIRTVPLSQVQVSGSQVTFTLDYVPEQAGMFDMALRIFPQNPMLPHRMDFALVKWA